MRSEPYFKMLLAFFFKRSLACSLFDILYAACAFTIVTLLSQTCCWRRIIKVPYSQSLPWSSLHSSQPSSSFYHSSDAQGFLFLSHSLSSSSSSASFISPFRSPCISSYLPPPLYLLFPSSFCSCCSRTLGLPGRPFLSPTSPWTPPPPPLPRPLCPPCPLTTVPGT